MFNIFFYLLFVSFIQNLFGMILRQPQIYIYIYINTHAYCNDCTHKYDVQFKQESPESPE